MWGWEIAQVLKTLELSQQSQTQRYIVLCCFVDERQIRWGRREIVVQLLCVVARFQARIGGALDGGHITDPPRRWRAADRLRRESGRYPLWTTDCDPAAAAPHSVERRFLTGAPPGCAVTGEAC